MSFPSHESLVTGLLDLSSPEILREFLRNILTNHTCEGVPMQFFNRVVLRILKQLSDGRPLTAIVVDPALMEEEQYETTEETTEETAEETAEED